MNNLSIVLYLVFTFIFFAYGIISAGLSPLDILDIPSILLVFGPAIFSAGTIDGWKSAINACKAYFTNKKDLTIEEKEIYAKIFRTMGNVANGSGYIAFFVGAIAILGNLVPFKFEDNSKLFAALGSAFAAAIITILYGLSFKYYFCNPAEEKFKKN